MRHSAGDLGRLDWETPQHGSYGQASAGMFGALPRYVHSLGGTFNISEDLADDDLAAAELLVLLHPTGRIPADRLQRIWRFVREGGSLLIVAEPFYYEAGLQSSGNEILKPTAIRVRHDVAISESGNWHALRPLTHPATAGLRHRSGWVFTDSGSSLSYEFTGRLLSYLANRHRPPQAAWRQIITLIFALLVVGGALYRSRPARVALVACFLVVTLTVCDYANRITSVCIPGNLTWELLFDRAFPWACLMALIGGAFTRTAPALSAHCNSHGNATLLDSMASTSMLEIACKRVADAGLSERVRL